jgi:hypothetical protein
VELEAVMGDERLHVLAYNFDFTYPPLLKLIDGTQNEYNKMNRSLIEDMERDFPRVSMAEYDKYIQPRGRGGWKSINYVYDLGLAGSVENAMKYHKDYGSYEPTFYSLKETCRIIREAGGIPVLAHPGVYWQEGDRPGKLQADEPIAYEAADILTDRFNRLLNDGIGGLECYHPWHDGVFTEICVNFCRENDLNITCGCDGHGDFVKVVMGCTYDIGVMKTQTGLLNLKGITDRI